MALALILVVAACGSVPRPFSPGAKGGGLPAPGPTSGLVVHPIAGENRAVLEALTEDIIAGLIAREVAAIPYDVANRYRLYGEVTPVEQNNRLITLQIAWQVVSPNGQVEATDIYLQDADLAGFQAADPGIMSSIAETALNRIAPMIGIDEGAIAGQALLPDLTIAPIRNAPGDGEAALIGAMVSELERLGRTASTEFQPGLPELEALVSVVAGSGGMDDVKIIWLLRDGAGRERGRLEQQNQVPANRLSRRWGVVAKLAASAAAPGIVDLLNRLQQK